MSTPMSTATDGGAELRRRAGALRGLAARLEDCDFLLLGARAGDDTWIGPTALACQDDLASRVRSLEAATAELRFGARHLEAQADAIELAEHAAAAAGRR